ncbi:RHS repeat-associated core domain-containing protein [Lentisphaerota bacterium WC36G]|nr:RHS repeat-associated core domain-containing protein [Lentisphaerae bacterium WC36]
MSNKYEYSPFGQLKSDTEIVNNPFKFSSEYFDNETNLVYYNYRYYNPVNGKWLSRDPIAEDGGFNIYEIVQNNPINYHDNLGQKCVPKLVAGAPKTVKPYYYSKIKRWAKDIFSMRGIVYARNAGLSATMESVGLDYWIKMEGGYAESTLEVSVSCYCNKNDGKCYADISKTGFPDDEDYPVSTKLAISLTKSGDTASATVSGAAAFQADGKGKVVGQIGKDGVASLGLEIEFGGTKYQKSIELGNFTWVCEKQED